MRTLQDFDPFNIQQGGGQTVLASQIDAVDIHAHALFTGGLVGVVGHDAADADGQGRLAGFEGRDAQGGHGAVGQIHQRLNVAVFQGLGVHDRDRDRRVLQIGLALGGGDDDVGQAGGLLVGGFGGGLGRRRAGGDVRDGLGHGRQRRSDQCGAEQKLKTKFGARAHYYPLV